MFVIRRAEEKHRPAAHPRANRIDLLHAAEAGKAILLINAIDDVESNLKLTDLVKGQFSNLKIIGRARDVLHVFELRSRGVDIVERETFESALRLAEKALVQMGVDKEMGRLTRNRFREHNLATLDAMFPHFHDEVNTISIARTARDALANSFERDQIRVSEDRETD